MLNGADLSRIERTAHTHNDRCGGVALIALEQFAFGQDQMHPRGRDPVDRLNGAGEFTFQGAQLVDVLHEAGRAQGAGLIEDFIANRAARWQALLGHLHAQPQHLILRHQNRGGVAAQFIVHACRVELADDLRRIVERQIREQGRHDRRRHAQGDERKKPNQKKGHNAHGAEARWT